MLCPYCKNEHSDQAEFCPITGQALPHSSNSSSSICPNCGASQPKNALFCPVCGTSTTDTQKLKQIPSRAPHLKMQGYIRIASIGFAALFFISLVIMSIKIFRPLYHVLESTFTPSLAPVSQQLIERVYNTPSTTFTIVPTQTQQATITPTPSWKQGILVYLARIPSGYNSMYMMNLRTETEPQLLLQPTTNQHYYGPSLSPDSRKVVFYNLNGSNGILDVQDLSVRFIDACNSPTFSPNGSQIICGGGGQFRILNAEDGNLIRTLEVGVNGWLPVFSPDGTEVAFAVFGEGKSTSIWRIDTAGGQPVSLASDAFENYSPAWSPDGNWIAYQSGQGNGISEIWVMDRNGENKRQITSTPDGWSRGPVWSPDGKLLAYVSNRSGSLGDEYGEVFVISVDTHEYQKITDTGGAVLDWRVTWGP